jgi:hypothetical protein
MYSTSFYDFLERIVYRDSLPSDEIRRFIIPTLVHWSRATLAHIVSIASIYRSLLWVDNSLSLDPLMSPSQRAQTRKAVAAPNTASEARSP